MRSVWMSKRHCTIEDVCNLVYLSNLVLKTMDHLIQLTEAVLMENVLTFFLLSNCGLAA